MPEPPVISAQIRAGRAQPAQILVLDHVGDGIGAACRPQLGEAGADRVRPAADHVERHQPDLARRSAGRSTRTRLASVIGVSGWCRMWVSDSSRSPTNRWPLKIVRPVSGKAGQAMVKSAAERVQQRVGDGADIARVRAVEGRAVLEQVLPGPCPAASAAPPATRATASRDRGGARLQRHHDRVRLGHARARAPARRSAAPCACRCAPACCTGRWRR